MISYYGQEALMLSFHHIDLRAQISTGLQNDSDPHFKFASNFIKQLKNNSKYMFNYLKPVEKGFTSWTPHSQDISWTHLSLMGSNLFCLWKELYISELHCYNCERSEQICSEVLAHDAVRTKEYMSYSQTGLLSMTSSAVPFSKKTDGNSCVETCPETSSST